MKKTVQFLKKHSNVFLTIIAGASVALIIISALLNDYSAITFTGVLWVAIGLAVGETLFIAGAIIMAYSIGESLAHYKHISKWRQAVMYVRKHTRRFGEQLITSRSFTVGFWMNFAGAVITSVVLIVAVIAYNSLAGAGVLLVLIIDLIATFGWRVPIEIARRKVKQRVN